VPPPPCPDTKRLRLSTSEATIGVEKPSKAFFQRLTQEAGCPAEQILYVGDRLDNDVKSAQRQNIATAFLRRSPWGASCTTMASSTAACCGSIPSASCRTWSDGHPAHRSRVAKEFAPTMTTG
jgi:histidinol phosphatase-like enzyme